MADISISSSYSNTQSDQFAANTENTRDTSLIDLAQRMGHVLDTLREQSPLACSLTNTVTINFVANAQLAIGAVAAMITSASEVQDMLQAGTRGMYMNLGTLQREYEVEYPQSASIAYQHHTPWVLDPVGIGAGSVRTNIVKAIAQTPPTIIRCNASEAIALAQAWCPERVHATTASGHVGVESHDDVEQALASARALAQYCHGCVAISGEIDAIVDEHAVYRLHGGSAMMTKVTGAGCSLGAVCASYACVSEPTYAALCASAHYNIASSRAAQVAKGPGSFASAFLDELYRVSADDMVQYAQQDIAVQTLED